MRKVLLASKDLVNREVDVRDEDVEKTGEMPPPPDPRLRAIAARITELLARDERFVSRGKPSWRKFAELAGLSDGHVRLSVQSLEAGRDVNVGTLLAIADAARVSPAWLISGEGTGGRLRDLGAWPQLRRETLARYPDVPDFAVDEVGSFSLLHPPDRLDAATIRDLARAWFDAASDELRRRVETAYVDSVGGPSRG